MSFGIGAVALVGAAAAGTGAVMASKSKAKVQDPKQSTQQYNETAADVQAGMIANAPAQYAADSKYAPLYAQMYNNIYKNQLLGTNGLVSTLEQASPQLQELQNRLNTQQVQGNLANVKQYGSQALKAFQNINPQLQGIQNQQVNLAMNAPQADMIQVGPQPGLLASNYSGQQVAPTGGVHGVQAPRMAQMVSAGQQPDAIANNYSGMDVQAGQNQSLGMYNQMAQSQMAKGGTLTDQETNSIVQGVMGNVNQAGRANDPQAIAQAALGLDSASQARLQQNMGYGQTASGLVNQYNQLDLGAQQSNQANLYGYSQLNNSANVQNQNAQQNYNQLLLNAGISNQGAQTTYGNQQLQAGSLNQYAQNQNAQMWMQAQLANQANQLDYSKMNLTADAQNQQMLMEYLGYGIDAGKANQAAQLQNGNLQAQLLGQAQSSLMSPTMTALGMMYDPSGAIGQASNAYGTSAQSQTTGSGSYNPYGVATNLYDNYYNAQASANIQSANNKAAAGTGLMNLGGSLIGGGMCWVARAVFGEKSDEWLQFREFIMHEATPEFRQFYMEHGPKIAERLKTDPQMAELIRHLMLEIIGEHSNV